MLTVERDINIAANGCSGFATSTQKGPFAAMLISRSRGTYLIYIDTTMNFFAQAVATIIVSLWHLIEGVCGPIVSTIIYSEGVSLEEGTLARESSKS